MPRQTPNRKTTARRKPKSLTVPDCPRFTGYKPCFPGTNCLDDGCVDQQPAGVRILIVNLEAMGNVLVTTSLLPAIKRKHPSSTISWITLGNAQRLLENNPFVGLVYRWEPESWLALRQMRFDLVMNIDKSVHACAFTMSLAANTKLGYGLNERGAIVPLNREAEYNYRLGLDDHLKFRVNQKSNSQLLTEAMGLAYSRDEYVLNLSPDERAFCAQYKSRIANRKPKILIGFNTGCSPLYANKKMTIDQHVVLIEELAKWEDVRLLLLGGPEDTERNAEIARRVGDKVVSTPTTEGIRRGLCYVNACDVVISGDSFGMHAAIGLRKYVIVWFGVSCAQEIDLYGRGVKLVPEGLECSPCWRRECPYNLECIQMIDLDRIVCEVEAYLAQRRSIATSSAASS